ncbi:MAG: hypothetical protein WDA14_13025 [Sphaerochaetaceae bacterium]
MVKNIDDIKMEGHLSFRVVESTSMKILVDYCYGDSIKTNTCTHTWKKLGERRFRYASIFTIDDGYNDVLMNQEELQENLKKAADYFNNYFCETRKEEYYWTDILAILFLVPDLIGEFSCDLNTVTRLRRFELLLNRCKGKVQFNMISEYFQYLLDDD